MEQSVHSYPCSTDKRTNVVNMSQTYTQLSVIAEGRKQVTSNKHTDHAYQQRTCVFKNVTTRLRTTLQHFHFFPVRLSILSGKTKSKFPIPERACPLWPGFCPAAVVWFLAAPWLLAGTVGAPCAVPLAGSWGLAAACLGWSLLAAWPLGVVAALAAGTGEEASIARLQPRGSVAIT